MSMLKDVGLFLYCQHQYQELAPQNQGLEQMCQHHLEYGQFHLFGRQCCQCMDGEVSKLVAATLVQGLELARCDHVYPETRAVSFDHSLGFLGCHVLQLIAEQLQAEC